MPRCAVSAVQVGCRTVSGWQPQTDPYRDIVARLDCLRGISTLTAMGLAVEIGDWTRFTGSTIGVYVGMVPSEGLLR
jgi:hypothetical protein